MGEKKKPNYKREYWVSITDLGNGMSMVDDSMTFYSDTWHYTTVGKYERLVDYTIKGNKATMYIIDWSDLGYDRCKEIAFQWVKGEGVVYRLD